MSRWTPGRAPHREASEVTPPWPLGGAGRQDAGGLGSISGCIPPHPNFSKACDHCDRWCSSRKWGRPGEGLQGSGAPSSREVGAAPGRRGRRGRRGCRAGPQGGGAAGSRGEQVVTACRAGRLGEPGSSEGPTPAPGRVGKRAETERERSEATLPRRTDPHETQARAPPTVRKIPPFLQENTRKLCTQPGIPPETPQLQDRPVTKTTREMAEKNTRETCLRVRWHPVSGMFKFVTRTLLMKQGQDGGFTQRQSKFTWLPKAGKHAARPRKAKCV